MAFSNTPSFSSRTLEDFKARLIGGAARPNLFEVELNFPSFATDATTTGSTDQTRSVSELSRFMIKTANLPASNVGVIEVPFRGRAINKHDDNSGLINPAQYQRDAVVKQFGRSSVQSANSSVTSPTVTTSGDSIPVLKAYKFYGVFPTAVSAIDLSYDSTDSIEEFTVDLQVQWWDALDSTGTTQLGTDPQVLNPQ